MSSTSVETFVFAFGGAKSSFRAISSNLSAFWSFYSINFGCERLVPSRKLILIDPYTSRAKNILSPEVLKKAGRKRD